MAYKQLPSSEFRVHYASLTEAVDVTVHGRVIGRWTPAQVRVPDEERGSSTVDRRVHTPETVGSTPPPVTSLRGPAADATYRKLQARK